MASWSCRDKFYSVVTAAAFTGANIDERDVCPELVERIKGLLLGDKGFIRPELQDLLEEQDLYLQTPLRGNMKDESLNFF